MWKVAQGGGWKKQEVETIMRLSFQYEGFNALILNSITYADIVVIRRIVNLKKTFITPRSKDLRRAVCQTSHGQLLEILSELFLYICELIFGFICHPQSQNNYVDIVFDKKKLLYSKSCLMHECLAKECETQPGQIMRPY